MKTETPPQLTPLEVCNGKIIQAKQSARAEEQRLQNLYGMAARVEFVPPADASIVEFSRLQREHIDKPAALRMQLRNFSPERFAANLLDVASNKVLLQAALDHVKKLHAEGVKKAKGAVAKVEVPEGRHLFQADPTFISSPQTARSQPKGGLFGQIVALDVPKEIVRLQSSIDDWPWDASFIGITAGLNAAASTLRQAEPPPATAVRQDTPWRVPAHM